METKQVRATADLPLVTLDNNALIALRNDEPDAPAVRELLDLNRAGRIRLNVTYSTSTEVQRRDEQQQDEQQRWQEGIAWLESLGIARENIYTPSRSIGFTTPGEPNVMTFSPMQDVEFNQAIHAILAPGMPFTWPEYLRREATGLSDVQKRALAELNRLRYGTWEPPLPTPALDALHTDERERLQKRLDGLFRVWINKKNDASGFHCHLTLAWDTTYPEHAVFVTRDKHFLAQSRVNALRARGYRGQILPAAEAVAYLRSGT